MQGSTDLSAWSEMGALTNELGSAVFTDAQADLFPQKFYRAHSMRALRTLAVVSLQLAAMINL
jgi:hypothetical protein